MPVPPVSCAPLPPRDGPRIDTEHLRQQHPIADVVAQYGIELRRSGASLTGRCPFHADGGRPNFVVYPRSGRWVCFRCDARGDAIGFVQQIEHLSFREAATRLGADTAPTTRQRVRRRPADRPVSAEPVDAVLEPTGAAALAAAVELYRNRLLSEPHALAYLASRGFGRDIVERAHLGYAAGDELVPYLVWRGASVAAARRLGLLAADGRERLTGRIVFPELRQGQPIWLIGRQLDTTDDAPRYLGLPGRKPLLGWDEASRDQRGVCVVEGPLDLLALRQWGVPGLALCGTGVAHATLELLGRWERLYTVFDADAAGQAATARLVQAFGERVIPVTLPAGIKDPAELAPRPDGAALFGAAVRQALASQLTNSPAPSTSADR